MANNALRLQKQSGKNKDYLVGILISCLLTVLIFTVIEAIYPYYFMTDDNADWCTSEYSHVISAIKNGRFPMYSFTQFCGQRLFANGQSGVMNPMIYIAAFLSKIFCGDYRALIEILALTMMIIGAVGAYILLKRLGACQAAAITGAVAWNFNTYNIWVGNSWILVIMITGVLPFFFYGSLRLRDKSSIANYLWAILPKVYLYYIGHPQFVFYAAVYDFLFVGMLVLLENGGGRIRRFLKLAGRYVLVYFSVIILILPQLIPQYQMIGMTSQKEALSFADFTIETGSDPISIIFPDLHMLERYLLIDPFIGYPLIICGIAGVIMIILLLTHEKEKILRHKELLSGMIAVIPGIIIAFLSNYSTTFMHILHSIPIVNRFHYMHRNNLYFTSLTIIFSVLAFSLFWRYLCDLSGKTYKIAGYILVLFEVINLTTLFITGQQYSRGPVYKADEGYNEAYASRFSNGRYICCGFESVVNDSSNKQDLAHCLRYNLSSYYGISNVSGYYGVYTNDSLGKNIEFLQRIRHFTGDLAYPYDGFVDEMRSQSVCWYIVDPLRQDRFVPLLEESGMTKTYEDEYGIVYYDPLCEPLAYDEQNSEIRLEQGDVNYLKLDTDGSFRGGTITVNYSYDPNLRCFVDGEEVPVIDDNDNWQMKFVCPAGEHHIMIRYIDDTFTVCCIITGSFVMLSIGAYIINTLVIKKRYKQC